ncbi:MAG: recombination protein RecR [Candidatus Pacebacteria bacterium]|nr:recombination protein RecR [Candidatus Paceibacterota bacterium]
MDIIDKLTEIFKEFPGIGERQARRFVYFLMAKNSNYSENLAKMILELKKDITRCNDCFRFFLNNKKENNHLCNICENPNTDSSTLLVVEKDSDLESILKSRTYNGKYFVLGGLVPIVEKDTLKFVRMKELINKINKETNLKEIILAFSISSTGDHTDFYIRNELKDICEKNNVSISSLGRGLSTGTELEYSDNETLKNALKNRK